VSGHFNLYSMRVDGSGVRRLTHDAHDDMQPSLSPDGSKIVFARGHWPNRLHIVWMWANGVGGMHRITSARGVQYRPMWDPWGTHIIYVSTQDGPLDVWSMNADGSGQRNLTPGRANEDYPSYSPDGKHIQFSSDRRGKPGWQFSDIYVADVNGTHVRRVTPTRINGGGGDYSPDGRRIVFSNNYCNCPISDILTIGVNGHGLQRVTHTPHQNNLGPRMSPDGSRITFYTMHFPFRKQVFLDVATVQTNGHVWLNLTQTPRVSESDPFWMRK
jgi:TolB protein